MDLNEFRSFISDSGLDVWTWIDMSISVACADHDLELRNRRDGIIQRLYAAKCQNCDYRFSGGSECNLKENEAGLPKEEDDCITEKLRSGSDEDEDDREDDEGKRVLEIKILLDDQNQSEECLIGLLERLVGMPTTFKTLKETDIGRHVSRLRKHSSNEVRRLVKILVRKWKDTVDEWVRLNTPTDDGKKSPTIEVHREGNNAISENASAACHSTPPKETMKRNPVESDYKSSFAKKRPHDPNFQQTQHVAKKQITSDFDNVPKSKSRAAVQVNNNGGGKYW